MSLGDMKHEKPDSGRDLNAAHRNTGKDHQYKQIMGPKNDFAVPTLEEQGIDSSLATTPHHGGESSALKIRSEHLRVLDKRRKQKQFTSGMPVNLPGPLLFLDMYFAAQAVLGHTFSQTYGNKGVRLIPWHLQSTHSKSSDGEPLRNGVYG